MARAKTGGAVESPASYQKARHAGCPITGDAVWPLGSGGNRQVEEKGTGKHGKVFTMTFE